MLGRRRRQALRTALFVLTIWVIGYQFPWLTSQVSRLLIPEHYWSADEKNQPPCPCLSPPSASPSTSASKGPLGKHHYRSDGLLEVNPFGPHPIFELIERSELAWENKLRRASSSLDEAVMEYRRRYNRNPPKGFDDWSV